MSRPPGDREFEAEQRSPVGWETPLAALALGATPMPAFFVRHHAVAVPEPSPALRALTIAGTAGERVVTLDDLQALPRTGLWVTLECAGNGRTSFDPPPKGVPWGFGAISTARWEGPRLRDVLARAQVRATEGHVVFDAHDGPVDATTPAYRRSLP
ncbi:MAG TPA: molybdopterin-dependent oxidoreductase, partial [Candidatus Eremiobacteraceae bacterium]|nr:molybdopterin-dependent oxidoreductase [Candidatus Eremiobacteraceae bacterium]